MTDWLVKRFVKEYEETGNNVVRTRYGMLASVVGIFCNVLLFLIKISIGFVLRSISVMADAFNNLSDAGSSIISFVGVRIASKPADKDHPFGHGRIEYISALVVSFLVIEVGFTFLKDAIQKIMHPQEMHFQLISVIILLLSVGIKLWLGMFNKKLGKRIHSQVMLATAADSIGDVITTSATILSLIVFGVTGINIDGFVGLGVSLVVMWAGISIAKDTLEPLIGEAVSPEVYVQITKFVEQYDGRKMAEEVLQSLDADASIHDFRMVDGKDQINLIFDMVVPHEYDQAKQRELHDLFVRCIRERDSRYQCVITVETSFINEKEK